MHRIYIDIETYSDVDIGDCGAYKYMASGQFEIMLIAYAIDDEPVHIIDMAMGERKPAWLIEALHSALYLKIAHNAAFERLALGGSNWLCTAIKAAYCGLALSLADVSKLLNLQDKGKMSTGKDLIKFFCMPNKKGRNYAKDHPDKWREFREYCMRDVEAEREIDRRLMKYEFPELESVNYQLDQKINDTGVLIDIDFVEKAIELDKMYTDIIKRELAMLTGIENPNSGAQLKKWMCGRTGAVVESLDKEAVKSLLESCNDEQIKTVLNLKSKISKSSTSKYVTMLDCAGSDDRARGLFQFYGATRTGRYAGRLVQLQNMPRNTMKGLDLAREIIKAGDFELASMMYDDLSTVLSELIRTALIAKDKHKLVVCDYSAIEARVLAWLAGEQWRLDVFATHGKIYEASASMMFGVPISDIKKGSELRQRGKVAELALGYGGSDGAIAAMDTDHKIPEHEHHMIVTKWREANPAIVQFWRKLERASIVAVKDRCRIDVGNISMRCDNNFLIVDLPVGRSLYYYKPRLMPNQWGQSGIYYLDKNGGLTDTYGGKLTENITQAVSRDLLMHAMREIDRNRLDIIMHVHDEIVVESPEENAENALSIMKKIMSTEVPWAIGLPLNAEGFVTNYYKKD